MRNLILIASLLAFAACAADDEPDFVEPPLTDAELAPS
jgi:hypothetical protein